MNSACTLILGGVSSGKSAYAEALAEGRGKALVYVATAKSGDSEMSAKIAAHQARRGAQWSTIEAPFDLVGALTDASGADVILVDCLSMWLTNLLLNDREIGRETDALIATLEGLSTPCVLVSNEVGLGGIEVNELARKFAAEQGRLNQRVARIADRVVMVTAGLPHILKGRPDDT